MTEQLSARKRQSQEGRRRSPESSDPRLQARAASLWHEFAKRPEAGAILSLLVVGAVLSTATTQFLTLDNLTLVARGFAFTGIAAIGAYLVILTGGIDLSAGSVMGLSGIVAAVLSAGGQNPLVAILGGVTVGVAVGLFNGLLIAGLGLAPFMVTLGMLSVGRGSAVGVTGGMPVMGLDPAVAWLGRGYVLGLPVPVWLLILIGLTFHLIMRHTNFGWYVYAIGGNEEAARLSGVRVRQVKIAVYTVAGLLAGIGGILLTARLGVGESTAATGYELDVIAAAVIGGTSLQGGRGSVLGAICGAALLGVVRNGLVLLGVSDYWQTVSIGLVVIFAVLVDRYRTKRTD